MLTEKYIANNLARAELAASVDIPAEQWTQLLEEALAMRKLVMDMQALFECKEGMLWAEG